MRHEPDILQRLSYCNTALIIKETIAEFSETRRHKRFPQRGHSQMTSAERGREGVTQILMQ